MSDLILTPDLQRYLLAAAVVLGVGGSTVATRLHQRWLAIHGLSFTAVYSGTLIVAIVCGGLTFGGVPLFLPPVARLPIDLALGMVIGWGAFAIDRAINRRWQRRELRRPPSQPVAARNEQRVWRAAAVQAHASLAEPGSRRDLLVIAVLEEVVFRGVLVRIALSALSRPVIGVLLLAITVVFALEHLHFGWSHVAGKLPFSAAATVGAAILGSTVMPIAAHVTLNLLVFRHLQEARRLTVNRIATVRAPF
jgi:small-conductance mechanosensitive channel